MTPAARQIYSHEVDHAWCALSVASVFVLMGMRPLLRPVTPDRGVSVYRRSML
jgi:hypothetical protein